MRNIKYTTIRINVSTDAPLDGSTLFTGTPATGVTDPTTGVVSYDVVGPVGVFNLAEIIGVFTVPLVMQGLTVENSTNPHESGSIVELESPPTLDNPAARHRALAFSLAGKSGLLTDTNYVVPVDHRIALNTVADDNGTPGPHVIQFSIARVTDELLNGLLAVEANSVRPPSQWLNPVRVASTANVVLATLAAGSSIDGQTLAEGDRVLLRAQTDPIENGIYVMQAAAPGVRSSDMSSDAEVRSGLSVFVTEGSTLLTTMWTLSRADPILIGTTPLTFAQTGGVDSGTRLWMRHLFTAGQALEYIPMDGGNVSGGVITGDTVRTFFPVKVRLLSVAVWNLGTQTPDLTTLGLHRNNNAVAEMEVTVDMTGNDERFIFDFTGSGTDNETVEGQFTAISFDPAEEPTGDVRMISYWEPVV